MLWCRSRGDCWRVAASERIEPQTTIAGPGALQKPSLPGSLLKAKSSDYAIVSSKQSARCRGRSEAAHLRTTSLQIVVNPFAIFLLAENCPARFQDCRPALHVGEFRFHAGSNRFRALYSCSVSLLDTAFGSL